MDKGKVKFLVTYTLNSNFTKWQLHANKIRKVPMNEGLITDNYCPRHWLVLALIYSWAVVTWLEYCRYCIKHKKINQSFSAYSINYPYHLMSEKLIFPRLWLRLNGKTLTWECDTLLHWSTSILKFPYRHKYFIKHYVSQWGPPIQTPHIYYQDYEEMRDKMNTKTKSPSTYKILQTIRCYLKNVFLQKCIYCILNLFSFTTCTFTTLKEFCIRLVVSYKSL